MAPYELCLALPATGEIDTSEQCHLAKRAEDAGYDYVFLPETWGREAFSRLGYISAHTQDVKLGTGIITVHSRSPALIAQAIATLDEITGGRMVVGLGLSGANVIENWHGMEFKPALRRQREAIEIIRKVLSGEEVDYDGKIFDLEHFHLRFDPPRSEVPIYVAAQGETNVELTGGFADGWMPNRIPYSNLPELREHVDRGAKMQDRDPSSVDTLPFVATCILEDGDHAKKRVREMIAFYIGAMGEHHYNAIAGHGFQETADKVRDRWKAGNHDAAQLAVSEELLEEIAIAGTPVEGERLMGKYADVADTLVTLPPTTASVEEIESTIENIETIAPGVPDSSG